MNMKPALGIFDLKTVINKNSEINNVTLPISIPRRSPRKRLYQENQYEFCISARTFSPVGILFDHVFLKSSENEISVTGCIRIDSGLYVQHFFKEAWQNHYPNGVTIEVIAVCLAKVC